MSYLHCPSCRCAYNVTTASSCPRCGVRPGAPADPVADVLDAAEQLARAIARATPAQLASAHTQLATRERQRALPAPGAPTAAPPSLLGAIRAQLTPPAPQRALPGRTQQALLTTVALAVLARLPRPRVVAPMRAWAAAHLGPRVEQARALLRN